MAFVEPVQIEDKRFFYINLGSTVIGPYASSQDLSQDLIAIENPELASFKRFKETLQGLCLRFGMRINDYGEAIEIEYGEIPVATVKKIDAEGRFIEVELLNGLIGKYPATEAAARTVMSLVIDTIHRLL